MEARRKPVTACDRNRREFCTHSCRLITAVAFGAALGSVQGCASSPTSPGNASALPVVAGTSSNNSVTVTIDASSPLASVASMALVQSTRGFFLVARTGQSNFTAVSAICTHQTCTIDGFSGNAYVCPCHGSTFDTSGHVLGGPAPFPLTQHATAFNNNVLSIAV